MNILEEIAAKTIERIRKEKEAIPLFHRPFRRGKKALRSSGFSLKKALKKPGVSFYLRGKKGLSLQRDHR